MIAFNCFSQSVTDSVKIPTPFAKEAIKDIIRLDQCDSTKKILYRDISLANTTISLKDGIIKEKDIQIQEQKSIVLIKDQTIGIWKGELNNLQKKYKKTKAASTFKTVIIGVLSGTIVYLLVK